MNPNCFWQLKYQRNSSRTNVRSMHASSGYTFVKLHHLFSLFKQPKEGSQGPDVQSMSSDLHQMIENTRDLSKEH